MSEHKAEMPYVKLFSFQPRINLYMKEEEEKKLDTKREDVKYV